MSYYDTTILADDPTGYWRINEAGGTTGFDSTANHYDGLYSSGITYSQPGAISGDPDTSIGFTGAAYFAFPYTLNIQAYTALSIELWIKQTGLWEHVVITANASTISYYLDGAAYVSGSGDPVLVAQDFSFVGSYNAGDMAKIAVYNYMLSPAQIQKHFLIGQILLNGGAALLGSGTGTASFDSFRVTQYPDPSTWLSPAGRAANSLINWNVNKPANTSLTVETSVDNGVTWSTIGAAGNTIPGLTLQPDATVDDFSADSHTSYTTTNGIGGSTAVWTWDTTNKRLRAVGGSKSVALYNGVSVTDVDMFADVYQARSGGLVWRWSDASNYYVLSVGDSAASSPNTMTLNKIVAGTSTQLATGSIVFPTGTHHYIRVTMLGTTITCYFDGVSILTATDGSLSSGSCGVRNDTGTSYYYYLYIQPQGQNVNTTAPDTNRLATKLTLSTTDPTVTPQVTDLQAIVGGPTFWPGTLIPTATYNSATSFVSSNAEDLKNQSDYLWSMADIVDSYGNYDVSFQPRTATPAPWPLDENNYQTIAGQQINDILLAGIGEVYGADLYRNRMVIKNAIQTASYDQIFVGDGKTTSWTLSNPIVAAPTAWTLNGLPVSFGLQGVDSGKQFYYQIGSTSITADNSQTVLTVADSLEIKYSGSSIVDVTRDNLGIPGTITQSALAAITGDSGIVTAAVDVSSQNMSVEAAETYGDQMLARYGVIGVTFNFTTLRSGIREGQQLMLYTPHFNLDKVLTLVTDVRLSQRVAPGVNGGSLWSWQISCSTGPALGSWVKLLNLGLGN